MVKLIWFVVHTWPEDWNDNNPWDSTTLMPTPFETRDEALAAAERYQSTGENVGHQYTIASFKVERLRGLV